MTKVELGDRVKDKVSGFEGVVVAITTYLTGCDRALLDPGCNKEGKMGDPQNIDVLCLKITKKKAVVIEEIAKTKKTAPKKKKGGSYDMSKVKNRY